MGVFCALCHDAYLCRRCLTPALPMTSLLPRKPTMLGTLVIAHHRSVLFSAAPDRFFFTREGMGEPLNNYDAVLASIRGMADSRMFKLSPRHITLSTVGVVPRMKQLTIDAPETQLALSLHAPNQVKESC